VVFNLHMINNWYGLFETKELNFSHIWRSWVRYGTL